MIAQWMLASKQATQASVNIVAFLMHIVVAGSAPKL
jgi:hypothetical protein